MKKKFIIASIVIVVGVSAYLVYKHQLTPNEDKIKASLEALKKKWPNLYTKYSAAAVQSAFNKMDNGALDTINSLCKNPSSTTGNFNEVLSKYQIPV